MSSTTIVYGRESWQSRTRRSPWRESSLGTGTTTFFSWSLKTFFLSQHTSLWINAYFWQFAHLSMPFISLLITILAPTMHSGLCTSPVQFNCTPCKTKYDFNPSIQSLKIMTTFKKSGSYVFVQWLKVLLISTIDRFVSTWEKMKNV